MARPIGRAMAGVIDAGQGVLGPDLCNVPGLGLAGVIT
jgi:hypothetical protein